MDLMLKVGRQDQLYHHITAYDYLIAYYQLAFVMIKMEVMMNYPANINYGISIFLQYTPSDVLYSALLDHILRS